MGRNKEHAKKQPSGLELQVLSVLYHQGPATARQVLQVMPDGKKRAYTTILSTMQQMEAKGLLTHKRHKAAHVFSPTQPQNKTITPALKQWVNNVFAGRADLLLASLLDHKEVSREEFAEIERLVKAERKRGHHD